MILVTVGTEQYPFNRLMSWIEVLLQTELIQEEIIVQYGNSTILPAGARVYRFLKEEKFQELIHQARIVIAHCGEGTLLLLDSLDKPYILVSRSQQYQEHVDDHQVELGLALSQINVPVAWSPGDLVRFIQAPRQVSVADVSHASAIALCRSLERRFAQPLKELSVGISK
ncbi:glycosyltransferase [Anabaena sp. FACHB-709]|uniref:Glucosyltransferase n=2 Tax=Nostocaceae TaxID=1162 RepID=A0A1Z4KG19_ANAVA|nr:MULTISPECIES: glycosyltransferase [Nostocaceae]BAY67911.1 glucosyltransferase [Trichormus variabilis NIES-23]HBW29659.1 glucosyl transferase [Nostoc sp. UBA8866]MBD2169999.1 glucosyl transferase [Anabaena cylindrica FACHB-318]MBD2261581.1 glucosyl transferase [Anabaena sp. FACHB-709]MBD2271165.1 glucosyl transferase [Nostoc sp. PCC 7120 = FACHB-418]